MICSSYKKLRRGQKARGAAMSFYNVFIESAFENCLRIPEPSCQAFVSHFTIPCQSGW